MSWDGIRMLLLACCANNGFDLPYIGNLYFCSQGKLGWVFLLLYYAVTTFT